MINWGTVPSGSVLPFMFGSYDGATGASEAITGLAVTDIEIYKGGSITQRASDAGYTLIDTDGIDIDTLVGINGFTVDTGDNTDAGFYAVGSFFTVVVASVTADAQTVNFVAGTFRLSAAEAIAGKPKADVDAWLGTAAATPTVAGVPEVDLTHIGGGAQSATDLKDFADAGYDPATNKVQGVVLTDTVTTTTTATNLTNAPTNGDLTATMKTSVTTAATAATPIAASVTGAVGSVTGAVGSVTGAVGSVTGAVGSVTAGVTVTTNNDKTGYGLSAAAVQAIWDALTSALTTVGSIGKLIVDNLNATISSRMATYTQPTGFLAATFPTGTVANTTNITAGTVTTATNLTNAPAAGDFTATMKTSLNAATPASVTGAVGSVTGAVGSVTGAVGSVGAGGITAASFGAGAVDAASLATDTATELADALLDRNMATGTDSGSPTVRTVRQALRMLRNKGSIAAGTLTVTKEDDTTASWTAAVTTTAGDPISAIDPASV